MISAKSATPWMKTEVIYWQRARAGNQKIANDQAWMLIEEEISQTVKKIRAGKLSPLAFHMAKNQMNVSLLSKYVGFNRLRVKLHLKPSVFKKLNPSILKRYGRIFDIEVEELVKIPDLE